MKDIRTSKLLYQYFLILKRVRSDILPVDHHEVEAQASNADLLTTMDAGHKLLIVL